VWVDLYRRDGFRAQIFSLTREIANTSSADRRRGHRLVELVRVHDEGSVKIPERLRSLRGLEEGRFSESRPDEPGSSGPRRANLLSLRAAGTAGLVFTGLLTISLVRSKLLPRWIGLLGMIFAVALLLGMSLLKLLIYLFPAGVCLVSVALLVRLRTGAQS
jgi:bifunctional DNA-binding transcriptional regulator/antitoxin component of YhaV-PrlF toxin-antitoxin module